MDLHESPPSHLATCRAEGARGFRCKAARMKQARYAPSGASAAYLAACEKLWKAEKELREQVERVAAQRRTLPPGAAVGDYEFFDGDKRVKLSELFEDGKPYLIMYHVMYWQDDKEFCPMCSMWIDGIDGVAHHVGQRANIVAATLAPRDEAAAWAKHRKWQHIDFLVDADPSFARAMWAEDDKGNPDSTMLVFEKTSEGVRHVYTAHAEYEEDLNRGIDLMCPTWHLFDLLPSGRGDFNASNSYIP